ncbi:hypothetical protein FA15DRAFT_667149 [Coprinopsis marcescibilis]|uniref:Uncharacterized protein n=1 Tax=Coprinopsis marcescibilis TaxID=230819 RepID=A0A5C3L3E1_COPMA|nr:hypothetical protein FA15DRAFT_667149 [Coprinopsis marcescibilis]
MFPLSLANILRPAARVARITRQRPPRFISSTSCRTADASLSATSVEADSLPQEADEVVESRLEEGEGVTEPETYKEFLERVAFKYREASPTNWLAPSTPFPMNPSFRPPPPISDAQREVMYSMYMSDPEMYSVRALAQKYNLSIKRVDAILRLKGLERAYTKNKRLQTGFLKGMEKLLGATTHKSVVSSEDRRDVHEADLLEQDENRDALRQRYQRAYWESIPEGGVEPVLPGSLEHARHKAQRYAEKADKFKSIPELLKPVKDTPFMKRPQKVVVCARDTRPTLKFIDVGAKFLDVNQRVNQIVAASRRSAQRRRTARGRLHRRSKIASS